MSSQISQCFGSEARVSSVEHFEKGDVRRPFTGCRLLRKWQPKMSSFAPMNGQRRTEYRRVVSISTSVLAADDSPEPRRIAAFKKAPNSISVPSSTPRCRHYSFLPRLGYYLGLVELWAVLRLKLLHKITFGCDWTRCRVSKASTPTNRFYFESTQYVCSMFFSSVLRLAF